MNFGDALVLLKRGCKVCRSGWNGKNMFLWLKPGVMVQEEWCKDPVLKQLAHDNGGAIESISTICMKTADNKVVTGWVASQADLFAEDWTVYFYPEQKYDVKPFEDFYKTADSEWDNIPDDEKVSADDLKDILSDSRFNTAVADVTDRVTALNDNPEPAINVFEEFKKSFKMGDEYSAPKRDEIQLFKAEVQNIGTQVLRMSNKDERLDFLKQAKEELLASADTDEKKAILEENFALFEDYINNN